MFASVKDFAGVLFFSKSDDLRCKLANVANDSVSVDNHCHEWSHFVHQVNHEGFYTFIIHGSKPLKGGGEKFHASWVGSYIVI